MSELLMQELDNFYSRKTASRDDIALLTMLYIGMATSLTSLVVYMHNNEAATPSDKITKIIDEMVKFVGRRCGFVFVDTNAANPFKTIGRIAAAATGNEALGIAGLLMAGTTMPLRQLKTALEDSEDPGDMELRAVVVPMLHLLAQVGVTLCVLTDENKAHQLLAELAEKPLDELLKGE